MEVKFNNVGYTYNRGTGFEKEILKNINFDFKSGKINAIVGKSGSGKTTILELIDGLIVSDRGIIKIGSYCLEHSILSKNINNLRIKVGLVFQNPEEQFFCKTVKQEIEFGINCFNYKTTTIEKRVKDSLKLVGLDETYLERDPFSLSHGEMRSVAIASILAYNPKIIIFDEPTIGLDCASKKNLIRLIKLLKTRFSKNIIVVSHDTDFLLKISDTVNVLEDGKIVFSGNKYDVFSNEKLMKRNGIKVPKLIEFSNLVKKKKGIKIGYRDEINDLIKDIYRYVK